MIELSIKNYLLSLFLQADAKNREKILKMMEENPEAKFLDCGCSNGLFTKKIAERIKTEAIYGIDFKAGMILDGEKSGIEISSSNLDLGMPFKNESFDVIHANQVIEHLTGTDIFLKEIYRVLKPGGYVIFSTPNLGSIHNLLSLLMGYQPFSSHISNEIIVGNPLDPKYNLKHGNAGEIHIRVFTYRGLNDILKHHGFVVEKTCGVGYYPFSGLIAGFFAGIDPRHAVYLTVKVKK